MCSAKSNTVHVLNYQNSRSEKSVKIIRLYLVAAALPPNSRWLELEILLQSSSNLPGDLLQKLWSEKWIVDGGVVWPPTIFIGWPIYNTCKFKHRPNTTNNKLQIHSS